MTSSVQQFLNQIWAFAPRVIMAIIIAIVGIIISKFVSKMLRKLLEKIKIDQFGAKLNEIDFIQSANLDIKLSAILSKVVYYFMTLIFLIMASDILAMPAISNLFADLFNLIPKLIVGFFILIFGVLMSDMIRKLVETTLNSIGVSSSKIVASFLFYFLLINVVVVAIAQAEVNTDFLQQNISILIGGGVLAFAIGYGLASKEVMTNFLSSFYSKDKVHIGDFIEIAGEEGEVIGIDKNSITLAANGKKVIFPLSILMSQKVTILNNKRLNT